MEQLNHDITEIVLKYVSGSMPSTYGQMIAELSYTASQRIKEAYIEGKKDMLKKAIEIVDLILWANDGCDPVGRGGCSKACIEALEKEISHE